MAELHDSAEFHLQGAAIAHLKAKQVRIANGWFFSGLLPEPASQTLQANPPFTLNCDPNPVSPDAQGLTLYWQGILKASKLCWSKMAVLPQ